MWSNVTRPDSARARAGSAGRISRSARCGVHDVLSARRCRAGPDHAPPSQQQKTMRRAPCGNNPIAGGDTGITANPECGARSGHEAAHRTPQRRILVHFSLQWQRQRGFAESFVGLGRARGHANQTCSRPARARPLRLAACAAAIGRAHCALRAKPVFGAACTPRSARAKRTQPLTIGGPTGSNSVGWLSALGSAPVTRRGHRSRRPWRSPPRRGRQAYSRNSSETSA